MENKVIIGKDFEVNLAKLNRHGFITGATGSGKTVTLKVFAENLAKNGIPVFLSDIKGDISSVIEAGELNEAIGNRVQVIGLEDFEPRKFDAEFFDVFGEKGIPLRTTISEMGPIILSKLLGLNTIQEGILNIAFKLADERQLLLVDIKDLRAVLNFVNENKDELSSHYGNISQASVGAILRSLLVIEQQGGDLFFGEPAFDINDLMKTNSSGEGIINILSSKKLFEYPALYNTFLLWLLSELYENLPEEGDLDKPKIVFFFDEAHILFDDADPVLFELVEKIVRLIRSKGVGIFFVTQKATDIPDNILSQLSNRVQHSLRAYTPKEQKEVRAIAESFRQDDNMDLVEEILNLKTGEAIVSALDEDSKPTVARKTMICPPESKLGEADEAGILRVVNSSQLFEKYAETVDPESAYEILSKQKEEQMHNEILTKQEEEARMAEEQRLKELQKEEERKLKELQKEETRKKNKTSFFERFTNNVIGSVGRTIGREITRGIFGTRRR